MAIDDIFAIKWNTLVNDRSCSFTYYLRQVGGADDPLIAQELALAVTNDHLLPLQNILSVNAYVMCLYVRRIQPIPSITFEGNFKDIRGTRTGEMLPPNTSFITRISADDPDLKASARIFIAGFSKDDMMDGAMSAALLAGAANAWEIALDTDVVVGGAIGGDFTIGVWSTVKDLLPRVPPVFFDHDSIAVIPIANSQKRRRSKRTDTSISNVG